MWVREKNKNEESKLGTNQEIIWKKECKGTKEKEGWKGKKEGIIKDGQKRNERNQKRNEKERKVRWREGWKRDERKLLLMIYQMVRVV
jgi:hypothetical protein